MNTVLYLNEQYIYLVNKQFILTQVYWERLMIPLLQYLTKTLSQQIGEYFE